MSENVSQLLAIDIPDLCRIDNGIARVSFHWGQDEAWDAEERFIFVFAGTQGGKTSFLPWWLNREIDRTATSAGGNDYLAVTSNYDLFKLKFLPEMRKVFEKILQKGRFWAGQRVIEIADPTGKYWARRGDDLMYARIILRSAQADAGLESATIRAAVMDECGMDEWKVGHWEAIQRRTSLTQGRVLGATTLYNQGWIKSQVYDLWRKGNTSFKIIQFPSYINPAFPREEYDRIARTMPKWKVNMFYRGEFDVPEGLIYDNFTTELDTCDPFRIPDEWMRYGMLDFGGVNTAAIGTAFDPVSKVFYHFAEYWEGKKTAKAHAEELKKWGCSKWWGGADSEDQWRLEFRSGGLPVNQPAIKEVEVGIDRVYGAHADHRIMVFNTLIHYLDEKGTYRRKLGPDGKPTEEIENKSEFHLMDAERYGMSTLIKKPVKAKVVGLAD